MQRLQATLNPDICQYAAHFGVPPENFMSSTPAAGVIGLDIGQGGLTVVGKNMYDRDSYLRPERLFDGVYGSSRTTSQAAAGEVRRAELIISDEIEEFCDRRNISPLALARIGAGLLVFAVQSNASPGTDLAVRHTKLGGKIGKLDSRLSFSISPINTIIVARKRAGLLRRA
jgi:hypothetical protein